MKKQNYLIILLLILTSFTSCEKEDFMYGNDFEKSYKVWTEFKQASNDSYRYAVVTVSYTHLDVYKRQLYSFFQNHCHT